MKWCFKEFPHLADRGAVGRRVSRWRMNLSQLTCEFIICIDALPTYCVLGSLCVYCVLAGRSLLLECITGRSEVTNAALTQDRERQRETENTHSHTHTEKMSGTPTASATLPPTKMKKEESFLGKLGGTLVRKKKSKEGKHFREWFFFLMCVCDMNEMPPLLCFCPWCCNHMIPYYNTLPWAPS